MGTTMRKRVGARPLRVLHITPEYPPVIWGGLGTAVGGLAAASSKAGISVGVLLIGGVLVRGGDPYGSNPWQQWSGPGAARDPFVDQQGVTFFHVAPHFGVEAGLRLAKEWEPDVIHLHTAWFAPVACAIREQTGIPIVFTVHSLDRAEYEIGQISCGWEGQDWMIRSATRVIALCDDERELLSRYFDPDVLARVRIVGNGIDDCPGAQHAVARARNSGNSPMILYTGRFVDRKGIHELLAAIPQVLMSVPDARFVLIGGYGGPLEIERHWMGDALLPFRDRVQFTGWLTPAQVAQWYAAADVLVVPSWYEPFGMVILEGMLYGLPIAAAGVGGPAEILRDRDNALLFPPKDTAALSRSIIELAGDSDLRRTLGNAAAREVRRTWLWPRVVDKMAGVYEECLGLGASIGLNVLRQPVPSHC